MSEYNFITCASCGVPFGLRLGHIEQLRITKKDFYCPNGHVCVYSENEADKLRRDLQREQQRNAQLRDEVEEQRQEKTKALQQMRSAKTKLKNTVKRATAGVCLECHRTFGNLAVHMRTQHGHAPKLHDAKKPLPLP